MSNVMMTVNDCQEDYFSMESLLLRSYELFYFCSKDPDITLLQMYSNKKGQVNVNLTSDRIAVVMSGSPILVPFVLIK